MQKFIQLIDKGKTCTPAIGCPAVYRYTVIKTVYRKIVEKILYRKLWFYTGKKGINCIMPSNTLRVRKNYKSFCGGLDYGNCYTLSPLLGTRPCSLHKFYVLP